MKFNLNLILITSFVILISCGGGVNQGHTPQISGFRIDPITRQLHSGIVDGEVSPLFYVNYFDPDEDLHLLVTTCEKLNMYSEIVINQPSYLDDSAGRHVWSITIPDNVIEEYIFEVFITDKAKRKSNTLSSTFSVI